MAQEEGAQAGSEIEMIESAARSFRSSDGSILERKISRGTPASLLFPVLQHRFKQGFAGRKGAPLGGIVRCPTGGVPSLGSGARGRRGWMLSAGGLT